MAQPALLGVQQALGLQLAVGLLAEEAALGHLKVWLCATSARCNCNCCGIGQRSALPVAWGACVRMARGLGTVHARLDACQFRGPPDFGHTPGACCEVGDAGLHAPFCPPAGARRGAGHPEVVRIL